MLGSTPVEAIYSSPYWRAIQTITPLAEKLGATITVEEDLRERTLAGKAFIIGDRFKESKALLYENFQYSFLGGESSREAQSRAVRVLLPLLSKHRGQTIAIGTHGDIMTLMLNHFDPGFGYAFWEQLTMPDIYRAAFDDQRLIGVERVWSDRAELAL